MSLARLRKLGALGALLAALLSAVATAAVVEVEGLRLQADGGFQPRSLPRHRFAPISFQGHFDITDRGRGTPPVLERALIDFDRDGRLDVAGLPTCAPGRVVALGTAAARRACRGAIVGRGEVGVAIAGAGRFHSPLTIFNGPRIEGHPSVVLHSRLASQVYAIPVPILQRRGGFRYRAVLDLPPIAAGLGTITRVKVEIGRRFMAGGAERSYVSARCSDNILHTHGHFAFADGTIIDGSVEKFCATA